jgi:hypothetical protein
LFGAASAGMQIEKGLAHADWWHWAKLPGKVVTGEHADDGPDALAHIDEDVQALVDAGANAYRFSIEWSRIEPEPNQYDGDALHGLAVVGAILKAQGAVIRDLAQERRLARTIASLFVASLLFTALYGAILGLFQPGWQTLYAAAKLPIVVIGTAFALLVRFPSSMVPVILGCALIGSLLLSRERPDTGGTD